VLGVIAAGVLLAVSAAMNYRFGFSLGKTAADGQIYGAASAAADCFKALVPFFFFAAWRNRMWSQAFAAAVVWVVVTGYSMTSALGHAALNRLDTSGQRAVATANYKDLRAESKRAQDQLTWIPAHRPPETVSAELNVLKAQRFWVVTNECTEVTGKSAREYCQQFHKLSAELASGQQARKLESHVADLGAKLATVTGGTVIAEADPQASVLAKMTGMELEKVQTAMALFVALLIEIGSGFGMYVAFAYWRMHGPAPVPAPPVRAPAAAAPEPVAAAAPVADKTAASPWSTDAEVLETAVPIPSQEAPPAPRLGANDNKLIARAPIVPESDVELFYKEGVRKASESDSISSQDLYDGYKAWSKGKDKRPLNMPRFSEEFENLGYTTEEIGGRKRYFGIALTPELLNAIGEKKGRKRGKNAPEPESAPADEARAA
jgi:hypothetical protein